MDTKQITLKLLVDKEKNQVVFAESDNGFVDLLLGCLTVPIGTFVRLTGKQTQIGCINTLYKTVEDFDVRLLQTEKCKNMLLYPKIASDEGYKAIFGRIEGTDPLDFYYLCPSWSCCTETHHLISSVKSARCSCGLEMNYSVVKNKWTDEEEYGRNGVFVKGSMRYVISDDLQISPVSVSTSLTSMLNKLGIGDGSALEEQNVNVGAEEVLHLLKLLLLSKTALTDMFLRGKDSINAVDLDSKMIPDTKDKNHHYNESDKDSRKISIKLVTRKSNNKVLYAQGDEEFIDLLFSFLTFPLGSIVKCLGGYTTLGCLDNLYKSVEDLSMKNCMRSEDYRVGPKLPAHFGCKNQLIQIDEQAPWQPFLPKCFSCFDSNTDFGRVCIHGLERIKLDAMNPKYPDVVTEYGGSFMRGPAAFMVTDELVVKPLSPMSSISLLAKLNIPISDLEERVICVGQEQATSLLKASLISKTVLSDVFPLKKPTKSKVGYYRRYASSAGNVGDGI